MAAEGTRGTPEQEAPTERRPAVSLVDAARVFPVTIEELRQRQEAGSLARTTVVSAGRPVAAAFVDELRKHFGQETRPE